MSVTDLWYHNLEWSVEWDESIGWQGPSAPGRLLWLQSIYRCLPRVNAYAASRKTFVTFALKAAANRGPALWVCVCLHLPTRNGSGGAQPNPKQARTDPARSHTETHIRMAMQFICTVHLPINSYLSSSHAGCFPGDCINQCAWNDNSCESAGRRVPPAPAIYRLLYSRSALPRPPSVRQFVLRLDWKARNETLRGGIVCLGTAAHSISCCQMCWQDSPSPGGRGICHSTRCSGSLVPIPTSLVPFRPPSGF